MSWAPLPATAGAHRAAADAIDAIERDLRRPPPDVYPDPAGPAGLAGREPGFTLFLSYLFLHARAARLRDRALRFLETAIAAVPEAGERPYLSHGYAGTAWVVQHLARWSLADPEATEAVDDALLMAVEELPGLAFDHQYGLVGFGVYALERLPHPVAQRLLSAILARLEREAEARDGGLAWRTTRSWYIAPDDVGDGIFVTTAANGAAGVVGLAGGALRANIDVARARRLVEGGLAWLWTQREGGLFPAGQQLAWDSGSLGIVSVARVAAAAAGLDSWERRLRTIAARLAREQHARVGDATLARGAAGALHMFQRWYRASGDDVFAEAARAWLSRLLRRRRPGLGVGGYRVFMRAWQRTFLNRPDYPIGWIGLPGFYNGGSGIGLALLAATTSIEPMWDRVLLLS